MNLLTPFGLKQVDKEPMGSGQRGLWYQISYNCLHCVCDLGARYFVSQDDGTTCLPRLKVP